MNTGYSFRFAHRGDEAIVLELICGLANYEKAGKEVKATSAVLEEWLFDKQVAEVLLVEHEADGVVGMAAFFENFSTWTGTGGMYLEDLFVRKEHRGVGVGRALMAQLARICQERGWPRLDWSCLDWNEPSLGFYHSIGAARMDSWIPHRLTGAALDTLAETAEGGV